MAHSTRSLLSPEDRGAGVPACKLNYSESQEAQRLSLEPEEGTVGPFPQVLLGCQRSSTVQ